MDLLRISWEATIEYCEQLAGKVDDFRPQVIVGLSRGGLVPARILSDVLGVHQVMVLGVKFYKKMGETHDFPQIVQEINTDLDGKDVLIVDDVADTGRSLLVAKDYLKRRGAGEIRVATIHYKPNSVYRPDYFVHMTSAWIAYPWERHEIEREMKSK
ncbi:MAG: phosphoribosyltransferase [Candidatus Micrarchaeota archaeon]